MQATDKKKMIFIGACWIAIFVAMLCLYPSWKLYKNAPKYYTWKKIQNLIKASSGENDVIVFEPDWLQGYATDGGRFKQLSIVTKRHAIRGVHPTGGSIWLVTMKSHSQIKSKLVDQGWKQESFETVDKVYVYQMSTSLNRNIYEFARNLSKAKVQSVDSQGKRKEGTWQMGMWKMGTEESWKDIKTIHGRFKEEQQRCIWFHPEEKRRKTILFPQVKVKGKLDYLVGILKSGQATPPGTPVQFSIFLDDEEVSSRVVQDTDTETMYSIDLGEHVGENKDITFQVTTNKAFKRHVCFNAWLRDK